MSKIYHEVFRGMSLGKNFFTGNNNNFKKNTKSNNQSI